MKKTTKIVAGILVVFLFILLIAGYSTGYTPWFYATMPPPTGDTGQADYCDTLYTEFSTEYPEAMELTHALYHTGVSPQNAINAYKVQHLDEGWTLIGPDIGYGITETIEGNKTVGDYTVFYVGFVKGITISVVLAVDDSSGGACVLHFIFPAWEISNIIDIIGGN